MKCHGNGLIDRYERYFPLEWYTRQTGRIHCNVPEARYWDLTITSREGCTKNRKGWFWFFPQTPNITEWPCRSLGYNSCRIYLTSLHRSECRREKVIGRRMRKEGCRQEVFDLWWVEPQGSRMRSIQAGSDFEGSWNVSEGSSNLRRFRGIGNRLGWSMKYGSLIDRKSVDWNAIICFGLSPISVSKVKTLQWSIEVIHLMISCTFAGNNEEISIQVLIDCEAMGIAFLDQNITCHLKIPPEELNHNDKPWLSTAYP